MNGDNSKEPIYSFLDFSEKSITDSFAIFIKTIYKNYKGDMCWFCTSNVCIKNNCVCDIHNNKCDWFIQHLNKMVEEDFNSNDLVIESNEEPSSPKINIEPILTPPKLQRLPAFDRNPLPIIPRNINFETDELDEFEIIEHNCPTPPRLRKGDFTNNDDDGNIIFTMI